MAESPAMADWFEIAVVVTEEAVDAVSSHLVDLGSRGVIDEIEPGQLGRRRLRAHLPDGVDAAATLDGVRGYLAELEAIYPGAASAVVAGQMLDPEDWSETWKRHFPPIDVGERLRIRPPWVAAGRERIELEIDPAMAFGTGHHESTRGCLLALEEIIAREGPPARVLDVGTGSGILSMAAARLGVRHAVAIDNDPIAARAARENAGRNGVGDALLVAIADLRAVRGAFPLILANLYARVLYDLLPTFAVLAAPGGWLVTAGLLQFDAEAIVRRAEGAGFVSVTERVLEAWPTLVFRKR